MRQELKEILFDVYIAGTVKNKKVVDLALTAIIDLIVKELPPKKKVPDGRCVSEQSWLSDGCRIEGYNQYRTEVITLLRGKK